MDVFETINLAKTLMAKHGLSNWKFEFSKRANNCGDCSFRKKRIRLSVFFYKVNDEPAVKDTILHEIVHALTPGHNHDYTWKRKCVEIGCRPHRVAPRNTLMEQKVYKPYIDEGTWISEGFCRKVHGIPY